MPRSSQAYITRLIAWTPARWPNECGRLRLRAQRPLPSMMMPMCFGPASDGAGTMDTEGAGCAALTASDLHHLGLLALADGVDAGGVGVGDLLELIAGALGLVLGDLAGPLTLVDLLQLLAAHVADGHARLLRALLDHLHVLAATLLGERRDGHPDHLAVVGRVETDPGVPDGLLDRAHLAPVVDLDDEHPRLGRGDLGELVQRGRGAVVRHVDPLDQHRIGAARSDRLQLLLQVLDGLVHPCLGLFEDPVRAHAPTPTSVPMGSPQTTRSMLPSFSMSNTTIGTPLSMQRVSAVLSITSKPRLRTSM